MMIPYRLFQILALLSGLWVFNSCGNQNDDNVEPVEEIEEPVVEKPFDREAMLTNLYDGAAIPAYQNFAQQTAEMAMVTGNFVDSPTGENLSAVQDRWKVTKLAWEKTEVFDLGSIGDLFAQNKIDKYPTNTRFLENNLDGEAILDRSFVANSGSTAKGLPALEYLLFRPESGGEILPQFTTGPRAERFRSYLVGLVEDLDAQAGELLVRIEAERDAWTSNSGNEASASVNELANTQVALLEEILRNKIRKPLGYEDQGNEQPDKVETPYANLGFEAIRSNIESINNSFSGQEGNPDLYDLLDSVQKDETEKLSAIIHKAIEDSLQALDQFSATLQENVVNDKASVELLSNEISALLVAIKVDMANILGLTIVFNDNDGD